MTIHYQINPTVTDQELNTLFDAAWPNHQPRTFAPVLAHSLAFVCAYDAERLIGFVNLAWDGGIHAFILDTTVHTEYQRQGIGRQLVEQATIVAKEREIEWVHVDFEPHLESFYHQCGFIPTDAGLFRL